MKSIAGFSLILVIVLVSLSAYLRLAHSGIGCADWPACYGRIGALPDNAVTGQAPSINRTDAYQRLLERSGNSLAWATPLHRLVASVLGLTVTLLTFLAWRRRRHRLNTLALLALTVWLAVLGIRSGTLHDPGVVMGNLAGGFMMLGMIGWLRFRLGHAGHETSAAVPVWLTSAAIILLAGQILLGGFTSANFAATACQTLPDCHGGWWPGDDLSAAFDLSGPRAVTPTGQAIGGAERIAIHRAHRIGAVVAGLAALAVGVLALGSRRMRRAGSLIVVLVTAEFVVGVTSVGLDLPIGLAVAHNWLAGLLLLALLWLLARSVPISRGERTSSQTA